MSASIAQNARYHQASDHLHSEISFSPTCNIKNLVLLCIRGGRSRFFRLRLRSCSKIFESRSGSGDFSNLKIRLLFKLRLQPSIQPQFTQTTAQAPATTEIEK